MQPRIFRIQTQQYGTYSRDLGEVEEGSLRRILGNLCTTLKKNEVITIHVQAVTVSEEVAPPWKAEQKRSGGRPEIYPFRTMEVGEIHRVPVEDQTCKFGTMQTLCSRRGRQLGRKFYCRVSPEDGAFEIFRSA